MPETDTARVEFDRAMSALRLSVPEEVAADVERKANAMIQSAANTPVPDADAPDPTKPAPPAAIYNLADRLHLHWEAMRRALGVWELLPDDAERIAQSFASAGVSPTAVAESLEAATAKVDAAVEAVREH